MEEYNMQMSKALPEPWTRLPNVGDSVTASLWFSPFAAESLLIVLNNRIAWNKQPIEFNSKEHSVSPLNPIVYWHNGISKDQNILLHTELNI